MANAAIHPQTHRLNRIFLTSTYIAFKFCFVVVVFIATILCVSVSIGHTHPSSPTVDIAPELLPGNPLPENVQCDEAHYIAAPEVTPCTLYQDGVDVIRFAHDRQARIIKRTVHIVQGVTVGDFIGAWGNPDAYGVDEYTATILYLYWNNKRVSIARPVHTNSPVLVVSYYLQPSDFPFPRTPWHGFAELVRP